jgi:hypothetical protein
MWRIVLALTVAVESIGFVRGQAPIAPQSMSAPQTLPPVVQPGRPLSTLKDQSAPGSLEASRLAPATPTPAGTAPVSPKLDVTTFDPRQLDLRLVEGRWQLFAGQVKLKDFGTSEAAGRDAVQLIHDLHLNQYGAIGKPVPVMEYWLSDGQAPQGSVTRHSTLAFDPATVHIEQVQGQWYLRDARQMLFNFGAHPEDAQAALAVVRHHEFNQVGFVGFPIPSMIFFLANPDRRTAIPPTTASTGPETPLQQAARLQTRQLATPTSPLNEPGVFGERQPFDWRMAELCRDHNDWKLMVGTYCLANFGSHEWDAREALRVLQHYRFTEHCRIGSAATGFSYFLANGEAPRGIMFGLRTTSFRPDTLTVRQADGTWSVFDGNRPLLSFGDRGEEAQQALRLIQRHHFDTLCQVGDWQPPAMSFLVRDR